MFTRAEELNKAHLTYPSGVRRGRVSELHSERASRANSRWSSPRREPGYRECGAAVGR